jgi:hypothetical protein
LAKPRPDHRRAVGGMWQQIGWLQFGYMVGSGLRPWHELLDVGCGSLRGGRHFVRFLEPGRYWGMDKERWLIEAGWKVLRAGNLLVKRPNLCISDGSFNLSFIPRGKTFHFALAQSVFTHLKPDEIKACLKAVMGRLRWGGEFHATYFDSDSVDVGEPHRFRDGERDIARYPFAFFHRLAQSCDAKVQMLGDWGHPRKQKMLVFRKRRSDIVPRDCAVSFDATAARAATR